LLEKKSSRFSHLDPPIVQAGLCQLRSQDGFGVLKPFRLILEEKPYPEHFLPLLMCQDCD